MSIPLHTPVTIILFNRPDKVRALVDRLRQVRPRHLLAIADGPRRGHPTDPAACRAAREAVAAIDWPCRIEREFAGDNLGPDRRITTGLEWAFARVDHTIVVEDDVLPSSDFFAWMERMLDVHAADEQVAMVSAHNPLAAWGGDDCDHLRTCRGGHWGWGTWARAWHRIGDVDLSGAPATARRDIDAVVAEPLLAEHLAVYLEAWRLGTLAACDLAWTLRQAVAGMRAVVSPVNLIRNTGLGAEATHMSFPDDFTAVVPVHPARMRDVPRAAPAEQATALDRAGVLVELLARCANPHMAARLARSVESGADLPLDRRVRHHLLPFHHPRESLAVLDHLVAAGLTTPLIERLRDVLRTTAGRGAIG
jgi:hypothetical protein